MEIDAHGYELECCANILGLQIYFIASICWESEYLSFIKTSLGQYFLIIDLIMVSSIEHQVCMMNKRTYFVLYFSSDFFEGPFFRLGQG